MKISILRTEVPRETVYFASQECQCWAKGKVEIQIAGLPRDRSLQHLWYNTMLSPSLPPPKNNPKARVKEQLITLEYLAWRSNKSNKIICSDNKDYHQ